jgi:hypothetical protein
MDTGGQKIEQLEFYLLQTAELRQEAGFAKLMVQQAVDRLEYEWEDLEGWEVYLPGGKTTAPAIREAKKQMRPDLFTGIREGKRICDRLGDQIKRLEKDDQVCSRTYTFLTGS